MSRSGISGLSFRKRRRPRIRFFRLVITIAAVGLAAVILWCGYLFYQITRFEETLQPEYKADAGIVLGASLWNDLPSPGLRERLDRSIELYRAGVFPRIIVTGGLDAGGATITEAEGMRNYLLEHGVPESAILLEPDSRSTHQNLLNAQKILTNSGGSKAVIITHRYHGARALDIALTLGYEAPVLSVMETKVMNGPYHEFRETLATAKWQLTKLGLPLG
jgi:uncharacterized SAM-binding protein YcdF (DUF218 family)